MNLIAVSHPGKIGDALWTLPTVRALAARHGCQVDFYTSTHCEPLRSLLEVQPEIHQMLVPVDYRIQSMDCGVQPWQMPIVSSAYEAVYQLGFRGCPQGCLGEYIAKTVGLDPAVGRDVRYHIPPAVADACRVMAQAAAGPGPYLVLASRGETTYSDRFRELCRLSPIPVFQVGAVGQFIGGGIDFCGCSILEMAALIAGSAGFVGLMSSPLVIANGFPIRKVIPHNGRSWDMSHVLYTPWHDYMIEPTAQQMLKALQL